MEFWRLTLEKKIPARCQLSDNDVIKVCLCHPAPTRKTKMNVASSGCSIYCSREPNPAGSVSQSGFMSSVVAPFPAISLCQYFCCPNVTNKLAVVETLWSKLEKSMPLISRLSCWLLEVISVKWNRSLREKVVSVHSSREWRVISKCQSARRVWFGTQSHPWPLGGRS